MNQGRGGQQWQGRGQGAWGQGRGWWRGRGRGQNNYQGRGGSGQSGSSRGRGLLLMNDPAPTRPQPQRVQTRLEVASPYTGWKLYFPEEGYSDHSPVVQKVQVFEKYFLSWSKLYNLESIDLNGFVTVDYKELSSDTIIAAGCLDLASDLRDKPGHVLSCLGLAMHQLVTHHRRKEAAAITRELGEAPEESGEENYVAPFIRARVINFSSPLPLKNLKANYYGKFVCVKGTVVRVSNIKPMCTTLAFSCITCQSEQSVSLPDGKYITPTKCPAENCRGKTFVPKRGSTLTETIDWQTIRLQEIMEDNQKEAGRIPRTVDCELTCDLVNTCLPGDIVTVSGVVKVNSIDEGRSSKNMEKCMFLLYILANSVSNSKSTRNSNKDGSNNSSNSGGGGGLAMEFSMTELYAIQEIQSQPQLFRLLIGSLCPAIYGHELVKAGLILGLFGTSQKFANDKNRIPVRGDPHILVVGDPGLGKSQMLQAAASIAPRSVYVCGNTTTTSGLTVTLSRDSGSGGDFALEAGALVLADQGCCCIDEFDKMGNQHQALLEAMEQQSISIAKAGIVCSLPARTSILAAANPVGGHYNKGKTVSENLKMGSALLSRFDLVFILLDRPDEEMDCLLSEHVMALHAGRKGLMVAGALVSRNDLGNNPSQTQWEADRPLSERLKVRQGEPFDPIPPPLLRKYIGYARKYVHPKIGPEAAKVLQSFYLDLRKRHHSKDSTPITTRQLESLIRLTEARARLELRELATARDAEEVVEIMKYSMLDVFSDQFGLLDFRRSQHGSGMSGRSKPKKFIGALQRVAEQTYNSIFTVQQMRQIASDIGLQMVDFEGFISSLNNQGFLLKKGAHVYQLQTFGY